MQITCSYLRFGCVISLGLIGLFGCSKVSELPKGFKSPQVKGNTVLDTNGAMITVSPTSIAIHNGESFNEEQLEKIRNNDPETILALHRTIAAAREAITDQAPTLNLRMDERTSNRLFQALLIASFKTRSWGKIALGVDDDSKSALSVSIPNFGSRTKPHPLMLMAMTHAGTLTIEGRQPVQLVNKLTECETTGSGFKCRFEHHEQQKLTAALRQIKGAYPDAKNIMFVLNTDETVLPFLRGLSAVGQSTSAKNTDVPLFPEVTLGMAQ